MSIMKEWAYLFMNFVMINVTSIHEKVVENWLLNTSKMQYLNHLIH